MPDSETQRDVARRGGDRWRLPGTAELVVLVAGLMSLNAVAIDVMLPALNEMSHDLGLLQDGESSTNRQQWIIFAYVFGFGAPQLVWGPVSDRFGRRAPLFTALFGYFLTSLLCIAVQDFNTLLATRFLQGVFASGVRIVAVSLVRDLFVGRQMARFMSLVMTIFMIVPILAPLLGKGVMLLAPWEWIFAILAASSAIMIVWSWARLPETLAQDMRRPLSLYTALGAYAEVFRSPVTVGYMTASGIVFGALFAFIASSEQIFREVFHREDDFVLWFSGIAAMLAVANFCNSRLVERLGMRRISHGALLLFTFLSIMSAVLTLNFGESLVRFYPVFVATFACFGLMGSNFSALAMEPLGKIAGTGSAAYGFSTTVVASLLGMLIGTHYDGSTVPLMLGYAGFGMMALIVILITERGRLFASR